MPRRLGPHGKSAHERPFTRIRAGDEAAAQPYLICGRTYAPRRASIATLAGRRQAPTRDTMRGNLGPTRRLIPPLAAAPSASGA